MTAGTNLVTTGLGNIEPAGSPVPKHRLSVR
jgi:hypothetical protein